MPMPSIPSSPTTSSSSSSSAAAVHHPLMTVALRVRPLSSKETSLGDHAVVNAMEEDNTCAISKLERSNAVLLSERAQVHTYEFDRVFSSRATNELVYESTVRPLIPQVLLGVNCTIFAYGSTGAGKTHTIMGYAQDPGMMPRSMLDLFAAIEASENANQFSVQVSYMEVYCETIRDLLSESDKPLNPCERASDGTVHVLGLMERDVLNVDEVLALVAEGSLRRKTEPTAANEVSSRSHAVLQVSVTRSTPNPKFKPITRKVSGKSSVRIVTLEEPYIRRSSRLSLIDLAGSERAAATQNKGVRLREGANINKSLLALANCINALSSNGNNRVKYRDSKLTHILKSSLEGDCRVVMLAAINPSHKSYEESHNTLKYAYRAKNIKSSVTAVSIAQQNAKRSMMTRSAAAAAAGREAASGGSLEEEEEEEEEEEDNNNVYNNHSDDEEEDEEQQQDENFGGTAQPLMQTIRNVFFSPQPQKYYHQHPSAQAAPPSKAMKMMSRDGSSSSSSSTASDDEEERMQGGDNSETLQEERDRVLEENIELKLELAKAHELIALLQQKQQLQQQQASSSSRLATSSSTRMSTLAAASPAVSRPPTTTTTTRSAAASRISNAASRLASSSKIPLPPTTASASKSSLLSSAAAMGLAAATMASSSSPSTARPPRVLMRYQAPLTTSAKKRPLH